MSSKDVCTLMFHDVYDKSMKDSGFNIDSNYPYKLHVSVFEEIICTIARYIEEHHIDKNYVQLSFDDGGESFYTIIMPILEKYGFRGYFYIATKYIEQDGFLTSAMIREMWDRGHVIGGHSHTHQQRMNDWSYEELNADWSKCLKIISDITGTPCVIASLPNGFISDAIIRTLKDLGVKTLYTSDPVECVRVKDDMVIRGRYGIKNSMTVKDVLAITFDKGYKRKVRRKKALLNFVKKIMGRSYIKIREFIFKCK